MKSCPTCKRQYDDATLGFCLDDGTRLVEAFGQSDPTIVYSSNPNPSYTPPPNPSYAPPSQSYAPPNPSYAPPNQGYLPPNPSYAPLAAEAPKRRTGLWIALGVGLVLLLIIGVGGVGAFFYFSESGPVGGGTSNPGNPPTPTPTPTPLAPISGEWKGQFSNSEGGGGTTIITIVEHPDGTFTGDEGTGYPVINGRRNGNHLTWEYKTDCLEYKNRMDVNDAGTVATGSYNAHSTCSGRTDFTGTYIEYKKQ
jgi:hypothetical protein